MAKMIDTIVAISTPPGRGGIGVVRLSGPAALNIAKQISGVIPAPRFAHHCHFKDRNQQLIDNGILLYFPGPHSYTGEDVLEMHAHGSRIVLDLLLQESIAQGARLAKPGEFTERAFLNGKLDLVQAEAVADLIDSVSVSAARSATRSLTGEFSKHLVRLLDEIIRLRVLLEGALDFPEEDNDFMAGINLRSHLQESIEYLKKIHRLARQGAVMREGIDIVILGRPNVGKSTFMNRLAGYDAAIVTDIPGTTRDIISEQLLLGGIPVRLTDTAGLRDTDNEIEQEGVRRARSAAETADLIVLLQVCGEKKYGLDDYETTIDQKKIVIIYNKIDLFDMPPQVQQKEDQATEIHLSAKTGAGMDLFINYLKERLGMQDFGEDIFMARSRHVVALEKTISQLGDALTICQSNNSPELIAEELRLAQASLGQITGEFLPDDLLGEIFSRFCIGK